MFKPKFNHVLVEIDDKDAKWGTDEGNLGGAVYREGVVKELSDFYFSYGDTSTLQGITFSEVSKRLDELKGKSIMWNEGHEAGTVFEEDDKKYALIYWWDIIGVKE